MHVSTGQGRSILTKILADLPKEREKLLEEESQLAEPESLPESSPTSAILDLEPPKRRKLQFWILCLNLRMNFLMNMEIPRITT
jgi:hypothetical protein